MIPITVFPGNNVEGKINLNGKSLPLKIKTKAIEPHWEVYIGYDFIPDPSYFNHCFSNEQAIYLRDDTEIKLPDAFIGFCFSAREFVNTMVGCAFSTTSKEELMPYNRVSKEKRASEEPDRHLTYKEFIDIKLEISDRSII